MAGGAPDAVKALGETAFLLKLGSKTGDLTIQKKSLLVDQADHYIARYPALMSDLSDTKTAIS